jgi:hypothetical protein
VFIIKFYAFLENMFYEIHSILQNSEQDQVFVKTVGKITSKSALGLPSIFSIVQSILGDRRLVIHVDDCQIFFKGVLTGGNKYYDFIPESEIMALALRCFCECITPYAWRKNIVWVFTGTRPTLLIEGSHGIC